MWSEWRKEEGLETRHVRHRRDDETRRLYGTVDTYISDVPINSIAYLNEDIYTYKHVVDRLILHSMVIGMVTRIHRTQWCAGIDRDGVFAREF